MASGIGMRAALPLLLTPFFVAFHAEPARAETKCTTKSYVCVDSRQGHRLCITTICTNEKGDILSADTIVLKEGEQTGTGGQKSRVKLNDMNFTTLKDKSSP